MKGVVEELFDKLGMTKKVALLVPFCERPYLHPGRKADIVYEGVKNWAILARCIRRWLDNYKIGERVYVAVLDMPAVVPFVSFDWKYEGLAKYPATTRDISMVVPKGDSGGKD